MSSPLLSWYLLNLTQVPSLALVCIYANVLITVCRSSPSGVRGRFIGTTGTTGSGGSNAGGSDSSDDDTTSCNTFPFRTFDIGVWMTTGDLDQLLKL